jgi:AraC-like DNA-binding protein
MKLKNICKFPQSNAISDMSISCFVLEADQEVLKEPKQLSENRMILVEQGSGSFLFDDVPYSFSEGTLIFGFERESFRLEKGENVSCYYIDFSGSRANSLFSRFGIFPYSRKRENLNRLIPFFKDCLLSTSQNDIDIASEGVLLYVFSLLTVSRQTQNDILQKIIEITNEIFSDPNLSMGLISKEIGYNAKYLSHYFKQNMKLSYREYLRSVRLKYALSLFDLGIDSVKNVATLSGFSDPLYFSTIFKKALALSPTDYIKNLLKKREEHE